MPRRPRVVVAGGIFHVSSRGVARQAIYRDDVDRKRFLGLLQRVVVEYAWRCLSYCLMGNHFHLLVQLREPNLSRGMQRLNGDYASWFNERHNRPGHLFEGRYWGKPVEREAHLLWLTRYIALNPVQASLCRTPEEWPWSAHGAIAGLAPAGFVDAATTLSYFDADVEKAKQKYVEFVRQDGPASAPVGDVRPARLLSAADRDDVIERAHADGRSASEIATLLGCHRDTVLRRLAANSRGV